MEEKLVSVIVPVFNSEETIEECINSIINQTYKNLEIICVNDGSSDNTLEILKRFDDNRIRIINKNNEGVSEARNEGILAANGDYIIFVDSDDCLLESGIEKLISKIMIYKPADMVIGNYRIKNTERKGNVKNKEIVDIRSIINKVFNKLYDDFIDELGNTRTVWGKIYRRDIIIQNGIMFKKDVKLFEDGIFNIEYLKKCNTVYAIDDVVYDYRICNNSAVHRYYEDKYRQDVKKIEIIETINESKWMDNECINLFIFELYIDYLKNISKSNDFNITKIKNRDLIYYKYIHRIKYKYLSRNLKLLYLLYKLNLNIILYFVFKVKWKKF